MATLQLTAYDIVSFNAKRGMGTINLGLGKVNPTKIVEIKTVADAQVAMDAFVSELKNAGKPVQVSARKAGKAGRMPKGFDAWVDSPSSTVNVNADKAAAENW
jgi:hypothetical protein